MQEDPLRTPKADELRCPNCGAGDPIRIAYGLPSFDMFEASERGEIALGGCIVAFDSPTWQCQRCGTEFGDAPARIEGLAAFFPGS